MSKQHLFIQPDANNQQKENSKKDGKNHDNISQEQRNKRNKRNKKLAEDKALNDKINDLKTYCEKIKGEGHKLTYENLVFNFDKSLVEICKNRKILIQLPDGSYDFGG